WPRPPALTTLAATIRRRGPLTVLRQLGRAEVGRRAAAVLAQQLSTQWVDLLAEQTGGQPLVLDETLATLQEVGMDPGAARPTLPVDAVDRLRFVVDDIEGGDRALLHAIAAGANVETGVLAELLGLDQLLVRESVERVRAGGFLLSDGRLIPLLRAALLSVEPVEATRDLQVRLLDIHAGLGHDVVPVARALAASGIRNQSAAAVLVAAADQRLAAEPAVAATLYTDAVRAGAASAELAVRRAEAAVCVGRFDEALQLADPVLADPDSPDLASAIDVIAVVMANRGQLGRAAELYRWLGPDRVGVAGPMAALAMLATGEPAEAGEFLAASAGRRCPTMVAGAMSLITEGVQLSLTDSYTSALSALSRATALMDSVARTPLLLESPAALTGLVALHVGEFELAESVLRRAIAAQVGGPISRPRHLLLLAWTAMLRGRHTEASGLLLEALPPGGTPESRDEILGAALEMGLARRAGDQVALARTWHAAREAILRQEIDLFVLLPLSEFVVAAAVMGDSHLLQTHVKQAWVLLTSLNEPDLWASPLRWGCVQAGAISHSVDDVQVLCRMLGDGSPHNGYGRVLDDAARCWSDILTDDVDADRARSAAKGLQGFGLSYEADRLLTEACAHCTDGATAELLRLARDGGSATAAAGPGAVTSGELASGENSPGERPVAGTARASAGLHSTSPGSAAPVTSTGSVLSGREVQVAKLLLRNQTYREIGERLFISPKTVEHHVARMKQRIGASRRSELFAELRVLTESWDSA
ncbi:MAG: helix-turn-helix transcriptional regulator, partial [Nakamurella sp.]